MRPALLAGLRVAFGFSLLALTAPSWAAGVVVPAVPAKFFTPANYSAVFRAWEAPMQTAFMGAYQSRITLTPELSALAPALGKGKDGMPQAVAPRSAALLLMTSQFAEQGITPQAFAAMPAAERVQKMQTAYTALQTEIAGLAKDLTAAGEQAEKAGDRAALQTIQSRLGLLAVSHSAYIAPQTLSLIHIARQKAAAAFNALTDTVIDGAANAGKSAVNDQAAQTGKRGGFGAVDAIASQSEARDPNAAARSQLLAPLQGGRIPDGFVQDFARYQQMGDKNLSFDALRAFQKAIPNDSVGGVDAAQALDGIRLIALEAPAERARTLAFEALLERNFRDPVIETKRVFVLRELISNASREDLGLIIKSLTPKMDPKKKSRPKLEGEAGKVLDEAVAAYKSRFNVPNPIQVKDARMKGEQQASKAGWAFAATGWIPLIMKAFGLFPAAAPSFLSFLQPVWFLMPYTGFLTAFIALGMVVYYSRRASAVKRADRAAALAAAKARR